MESLIRSLKVTLLLTLPFTLLLTVRPAVADEYADEIETIAARRDVQVALNEIDGMQDETIDWIIKLTEIPAPPFKEANRGEFYAFLLEEAGLDKVETDAVGNVIARMRGSDGGKTLAVVAHLDTVFPEGTNVVVRSNGNQYCAPGIGDNGRGLVAMLAIAHAINSADIMLRGDVLLVASVGEEGVGDLRGVRHLLREGGPSVDEFIAIDGGGSSRIVTSSVGSIRYKLIFKGAGGHSWGAFGLGNPAHALSRAIYYFDQTAHTFVSTEGDKATYNVGRLGGGTSVNSVPFENWAEIDMRSANQDRLNQIEEILKTSAEQALLEQNALRTRGDSLTYDLVSIGNRPGGTTDEKSPLVQRLSAALRHHGIEPEYRESSTDANIPMSQGIPGVTIGGGGTSQGSHSLHECWVDENSAVAVKSALLAIIASAGI